MSDWIRNARLLENRLFSVSTTDSFTLIATSTLLFVERSLSWRFARESLLLFRQIDVSLLPLLANSLVLLPTMSPRPPRSCLPSLVAPDHRDNRNTGDAGVAGN